MERADAKLLGSILNEYVRERGLTDDFESINLRSVWNNIMGKRVVGATDRFSFRKGVLYITFSSSLIRNKLYFDRERIIASINRSVGRDIVKKIVFK